MSSQEDSPVSSTSVSESLNPLYSPAQVSVPSPPQARPKPKPRKANRKSSQQREESEPGVSRLLQATQTRGDSKVQETRCEREQSLSESKAV